VNDVRLRSIERIRVMSDILGGMECLKSQTIQEFTLGKKTTNWLESPTSPSLEVLRNNLELRNLIFIEMDVFLEIIDSPHKFLASCCFEHFHQTWVNIFPDTFFFLSVIKSWNRITNFVVKSDL